MTNKTNIYSMLVFLILLLVFSCSQGTDDPGVVFKLFTPEKFTVSLRDYASVELRWDEVKGADYKVYYGKQSGVYDGVLAYQGKSPIETSDTSIILEGLEIGTTYYFVVTAFSYLGETAPTPEAYITPQAPPIPPDAPTGLSASALDSSTVKLDWNDNSLTEKGYYIFRSLEAAQGFSQIADITAPAQSYTDNNAISEQTTYYYKISAYNDNGPSNFSNTATATTPTAPVEPPSAPSNLRITDYAHNFIKIEWNDNSSNEDKFQIYRSEVTGSCSTFTFRDEVTSNVDVYQDSPLTAERTYYYCIRANNTAGPSVFIGPVSQLTDPEPPSPPNTPYGLNATKAGADKINLSWQDNSDNEDGFIIERSLQQTSGYSECGRVEAPNTTTYQAVGLNSNTLYWFRIVAYNSAGNSNSSVPASATTGPAIPAAPLLTSASAAGPNSVDLTWNDNSSTETGFKILRSSDNANYSEVGTVGANVSSHTDSNGLSPSTNYWYKIEAYNESGSGISNSLSVATEAPGAPAGLSADGSLALEEIMVSWNGVQGATGYRLYYSTSPAVSETSASIYTTSTSYPYTDWGICGTRFYFRVRVEGPAPSALSNTVSAVTRPCQIESEWYLQLSPSLDQITVWFFPLDFEPPSSYKIEYTNIDSGNVLVDTIDDPGDFSVWEGHEISGLTNGARYYVNVTSVNESGEGPVSTDKVAQPGKSAPLSLHMSSVYNCGSKVIGKMATPAAVDLYWNAPNTGESIYGYHINIQDLGNGEDWYENFNASTTKIAQGLSHNNWVTIYITAIYADGDSASSNILRFCPCGGCP